MVSVLVEDLPSATADFLHRRARRMGAPSVLDQVRHELITMAREDAPVDQVVQFVEQNHPHPAQPEIDADATALASTYALPADVWDVLCRRAAVSHVPVSQYVYDELATLPNRSTIDDVMWEFREAQEADPSLDMDFEAIHAAVRYARGLD